MLPVTPQPHDWSGVCVSIALQAACWFLFRVVVVSGSPEDRTRHNLVISKAWTTSPRLPFEKVGHLGVEPRAFRSQSGRASICTCIRCCVVFAADDPVGAYLPCQWAGRRSNPRLRFFRPPLDRLSYQPMLGLLLSPVQCRHEKRPDVCMTSGLDERRFERSRRHMRKRYAGASLFDGVPPKRLPSHICSSRLD